MPDRSPQASAAKIKASFITCVVLFGTPACRPADAIGIAFLDLDNPCAAGDFGGAVQKLGAACSSAIGRLRYALDGDVVVPGEGRYLRAGFHHTAAGAKMIVSARAGINGDWLKTKKRFLVLQGMRGRSCMARRVQA